MVQRGGHFMAIVNILGFLALDLLIAGLLKERHTGVMPITVAVLLIALYILSVFRALSCIDWVWIAVIAAFLFWAIKTKQLRAQLTSILDADMLAALISLLLVFFLVQGRIAGNADELGVWALEVKSMFYENGFARQNCYASLGYGNYFPGQMLFETWVCHFHPKEFAEGLMYVGYYWLYACFWIPLLAHITPHRRRWSVVTALGFCVVIMILPSVADSLGYSMLSAELILSAAFGAALYSFYDKTKHNKIFLFLRSTACIFVLLFTKKSGIYFAVVAVVYGIVLTATARENKGQHSTEQLGWKGVLSSFLSSFALVETWDLYCRILNRVSYFDALVPNSMTSLIDGEYTAEQFDCELIKSFFLSLVFEPLTTVSL